MKSKDHDMEEAFASLEMREWKTADDDRMRRRWRTDKLDYSDAPGEVLHPEFHVTTADLMALVRHWWKVHLDITHAVYCQRPGNYTGLEVVAFRRVEAIAKFLGDEVVDTVIEFAQQEVAKSIGPELWDALMQQRQEEFDELLLDFEYGLDDLPLQLKQAIRAAVQRMQKIGRKLDQ
jgi:hypothetical protein